MSIVKGQIAPAFSLYNTEKIKVTLYDHRGSNVVLLFFPLAFTGTCTKELCNVRDNIALYNNMHATVFGISIDSLFTLKKYKEEQGLNFDLLSDFNRQTAKEYDVLYDVFPSFEMQGVSKRAVFIIDKEGVVQYNEICAVPSDLPDFEAMKKVLEGLNS